MTQRRLGRCATAFALLVAASQASAAVWQSAQPFVGVTHWRYIESLADTASQPQFAREVVVDIMEINLAASGIRFEMSPSNGAVEGEVTLKKTSTFVNGIGAQIGINTGFYDTAPTTTTLPNTNLNYATARNGDVYSAAAGGEALFNISQTNVPRIGTAGAAGSLTFNNGTALYNATGGNQRILNAGVASAPPTASYTTTLNPHTAIGVSQDLTKVFLATVDGRQADYSEGMTTIELANVMAVRGAWNAINVDGGGSTTMVMDDSNDSLHNSRLINSPSDNSTSAKAGTERSVGSSLAVFATPLAGYVPLATVARPSVSGVTTPLFTSQVTLDNFEGTKGHFASAVNASGSSSHIASTSASVVDTSVKNSGNSSLKVNIDNTGATPTGMQLRFLSGGGSPGNNITNGQAMGNNGFVGAYVRLDSAAADLWVSIIIDDGNSSTIAHERGEFFKIVADGQFHLYQWDLSEDGNWANFNGGNGVIDGPNAFIDSLYFSSANGGSGGTNFGGSVWIDDVGYNPNGRLVAVPEPTTLLAAAGLLLVARRRR